MPRYFFDVHDGGNDLDASGVELIDIDAAKVVAISVASCLLKNDPKQFWSDRGWHLRVRGETGVTLFEIALLVRVTPRCARSAIARRSSSISASDSTSSVAKGHLTRCPPDPSTA